ALRAVTGCDTARERDQVAQRGAEGHLVDARLRDRAAETEQLGARRLLGADLRERRAALEHDERDVGQRLHVVDHGGPAEQARLHRERRLVARLAAEAFDRIEDRGFFAADVRTGPLAYLDVEPERLAENRFA